MALTLEPDMLFPRLTIESKHTYYSFDGRGHTTDFDELECKWFVDKVREACISNCRYPAKFSQTNDNGTKSVDYFGVTYFESERYYVRVRQKISFENDRCIGEQDDIRENYIIEMRPKGNTEPSYRTICDVTNTRCVVSDVEAFRSMQRDFGFLRTLLV